MTQTTSEDRKRLQIELDMDYQTLKFYFDAVLPEVGEPTRASMARQIAESHAAQLEARIAAERAEAKFQGHAEGEQAIIDFAKKHALHGDLATEKIKTHGEFVMVSQLEYKNVMPSALTEQEESLQ